MEGLCLIFSKAAWIRVLLQLEWLRLAHLRGTRSRSSCRRTRYFSFLELVSSLVGLKASDYPVSGGYKKILDKSFWNKKYRKGLS